MKKINRVLQAQTSLTTGLTLLLIFGLTSALWFATSQLANAVLMTPAQMIEAGLPPGVQIKSAGKPQFLTAVCAAVKGHRESAAAIAKTAVRSHHEYAGDIVATAVRCARGEKADCALTGTIVAAAISASPDDATVIDDAAVAVAPDCADSIQQRTETTTESDGKEVLDGKSVLPPAEIPAEGPGNFTGPQPTNQVPPLGPIGGGGGGFNPQEPIVLVCDNGHQRSVPSPRVQRFLNRHPGSFVGSCNITPSTSR